MSAIIVHARGRRDNVSMAVVRNCILPEDLSDDVEQDLWMRLDAPDRVTLGLTDVGQTRAGRILIVTMRRRPGDRVRRGQVLAVLEDR